MVAEGAQLTLEELARQIGAEVQGDRARRVRGVAGLAEAGRKIPEKGKLLNSFSANWTRKYRQAPMFSGSSCTQMTGVAAA